MPLHRVPAPAILFAPDCGDTIGGGHVMRCLTLARTLAARGWTTAFQVGSAGRRLLQAFDWNGPVVEAAGAAGIVVLDNYRLGAEAEAPLRAQGRRVVVLDDLADRPHACDLLIDVGFERRAEDYAALAPDARILAGPTYALLRPGFAALRPQALARRDGRAPERVLVSLGLTDLGGITGRVVDALLPELGAMELDVLVGLGAPSLSSLQELARTDDRVSLQVNAPNVEELMSRVDLAVGAGGSSTWERACLGLPSLALILADNQRDLAHDLDRVGATLAVEAQGGPLAPALLAGWRRLAGDRELRVSLAQRSAKLCDGEGAERVADAIAALASGQTPSSGSAGS
jgi:UDP-2,4-diacetamido-2,4,6-trideoxy-beta-L-altropyranose hydrolase